MDDLILIIGQMTDVYPDNTKWRKEVVLLMRKILKLYVVSSNQNLYAYQTAIESIQECQEIIDESLDVIQDKDLPVYHQSDEVNLIVNLLQDCQNIEGN